LVLDQGLRTPDIHTAGTQLVNTSQMGDAVAKAVANA
jgi:3-isopropylmalate dehydrogenase